MMKKLIRVVAQVLAIATCIAAVHAEVAVELTAQKLVVTDGKETLVSADKTAPGDVVLYTAVYRNTGSAAVHNLTATLPIPAGMEFLPDTTTPAGAKATDDVVPFQPIPIKQFVTGPDGKKHKADVPFSAYRKLRWTIGDLAAGATATVSARARVTPAAAEAK